MYLITVPHTGRGTVSHQDYSNDQCVQVLRVVARSSTDGYSRALLGPNHRAARRTCVLPPVSTSADRLPIRQVHGTRPTDGRVRAFLAHVDVNAWGQCWR